MESVEVIDTPTATNGHDVGDRKLGRLGTLEKQHAELQAHYEELQGQVKMLLDERTQARKLVAQQMMSNTEFQQQLLAATPEERQLLLDEIAKLNQ